MGTYTQGFVIGVKSGGIFPKRGWQNYASATETTAKDVSAGLGRFASSIQSPGVVCVAAMDTMLILTSLAEKHSSVVKN